MLGRMKGFAFVALAACGAVLGACSQGSNGTACPLLAAQGPPLYSPSPGTTGVSTAAGTLSIVNNPPTTIRVSLVSAGGAPFALGTMSTPVPGLGRPTPAYVTFAYPQLASATIYTVQYADASQARCPLAISPGGSFTTQ